MDNKEDINNDKLKEQFVNDNAKLNIGDVVRVSFYGRDVEVQDYNVIDRYYSSIIDDIIYTLEHNDTIILLMTVKESDIVLRDGIYVTVFKF